MTDLDATTLREKLAQLPEETSHGETPPIESVYLPQSHAKALHPDSLLVTGMRGAGKTFWWTALQESDVRQLVAKRTGDSKLNTETEVKVGFGIRHVPDAYPGKDMLLRLMQNVDPRILWRTVVAWQLAPEDHPLHGRSDWPDRVRYVSQNPEPIDGLFYDKDREFERKGSYFLILFDALDRCADEWKDMYPSIRGLLRTALDMRGYRRLRLKVFLRSDQFDEAKIADFPDASKVLSSRVELRWPRHELYGMLWQYLANEGEDFRRFIRPDGWTPVQIRDQTLFSAPSRSTFPEETQRERFHAIAGDWMGRDRRRGFPYTWIPNHLADTESRVSPRSFLAALRTAAEDTYDRYPQHVHSLHYESIKRGVQAASQIRVRELKEDYPWVDKLLKPLKGMVVPCRFEEISDRWQIDSLKDSIAQEAVKLPPQHIDQGADGIREDLESLGIFMRMRDGRVNIPDVFRVGYGLGRRGGVKPV